MRKKLFEILSWKRDEDFIVVNIEPNKYIESDTIVLHEWKFEHYLKTHDRLYFETHDISTGQYTSKSHTLTIDEYFEHMTYNDVIDDLYDYISVKHIDFHKSWNITQNAINSILSHFNL